MWVVDGLIVVVVGPGEPFKVCIRFALGSPFRVCFSWCLLLTNAVFVTLLLFLFSLGSEDQPQHQL